MAKTPEPAEQQKRGEMLHLDQCMAKQRRSCAIHNGAHASHTSSSSESSSSSSSCTRVMCRTGSGSGSGSGCGTINTWHQNTNQIKKGPSLLQPQPSKKIYADHKQVNFHTLKTNG
jgi:hypothetical protein